VKLTLLGTGTPIPDLRRRGPSQVVEVGTRLLLIDCGRGSVDQLMEAGYVQPGGRALRLPMETIALTHLHSDHITGLPDLLWAGWVMRWWERPPTLVGPPGTAAMVRHLMDAFAYDIAVREQGEGSHREELVPLVVEVAEGWASEGDGWRLQSFRVDHAPVDEAFGFRVDTDAGSVVISGDTRYSENLIRHAQGTDLLVHEVYSRHGMEQRRLATRHDARQHRLGQTIASYHTPSDQVGKVAALAEAKHLVLSHLVWGMGGGVADITADASRDFPGRLTLGADLDAFAV
jgi:ribonuclease Z